MSSTRAGRIVTALALAAGALVAAPAAAATPPPAVAGLKVYARYDHTLRVSWQAPQEAYQRGAAVIARWTRGYTPAATPSAGYDVTYLQRPINAQARPLTADAPYTFAVWVRSSAGLLSARRTVTAWTLRDVTPPQNLGAVSTQVTVTGASTVKITLGFQYLSGRNGFDVDIAGVRVVRNTRPTTAGGTVYFVPGRATSFVDPVVHARNTQYYYWALPRDTSGHYAYTYVGTIAYTTFHRISGTYTYDSIAKMYPPFFVPDSYQTVPEITDPNYHYSGRPALTWNAYVRPGRYTVCQGPYSSPSEYQRGCWTPHGVENWEESPDPTAPPPTDAIDAVDARTSDVSGIDLTLNPVF